jgi:hypothetical protein
VTPAAGFVKLFASIVVSVKMNWVRFFVGLDVLDW